MQIIANWARQIVQAFLSPGHFTTTQPGSESTSRPEALSTKTYIPDVTRSLAAVLGPLATCTHPQTTFRESKR